MKTAFALPVCLLASLAVGAAALQDATEMMPTPAEPAAQHAWLQRLVGEWTCTVEAAMDEGLPPMTFESTESVRSIGGLWIVAESRGELAGSPFASMLTLGYDPEKKAFVGSWIDTMHTHLWTYTGQLDEASGTLTLDTEGPSFEQPGTMGRYRETLQLVAPDHKVFTSSYEKADGTFEPFMRAEYRRK